jgi:5,10-methenyltetrahydrofolate synthetase
MLEKIELRLKLKAISMVNSDYDTSVLTKLNDIIKNKTICTYIPLQNEININGYLSTHSLLTTTCVVNEEIKVCKYEEPLEKNKYNVYQPKNLKIVDSADIFLVPGIGFDINGRRLGRGGGIYDQLLSKFPNSIFLGVTDRNHLVECIPHEIHDISMDGLITHDEFIEINI